MGKGIDSKSDIIDFKVERDRQPIGEQEHTTEAQN